MSDPRKLIEAQRRKVAELLSVAEREKSVLAGMEAIAEAYDQAGRPAKSLSPTSPQISSSPDPTPVGPGRQPGAISQDWRNVLAAVGRHSFTDADLQAYAQGTLRRAIRAADAKRRREAYQANGLIEDAGDGLRYRISDRAAEKLGINDTDKGRAAEAAPGDSGN